MNIYRIILVAVDFYRGIIRGRTLLQKRLYFLSLLLKNDFGYNAHYYGPFSSEVEDGILHNKAIGFIEEKETGIGSNSKGGFEKRRYDYKLTKDGKRMLELIKQNEKTEVENIVKLLAKIKNAGDNGDYVKLSIAAKTHYIVSKRPSKGKMTFKDIKDKAKFLGWEVEENQINEAASFLEKLDLIKSGT